MDTIMALKILERNKNAQDVQNVLTKFGCIIKVRLGLHEAGNVCTNHGLVILQLDGPKEDIEEFKKEIASVDGVSMKVIEI